MIMHAIKTPRGSYEHFAYTELVAKERCVRQIDSGLPGNVEEFSAWEAVGYSVVRVSVEEIDNG